MTTFKNHAHRVLSWQHHLENRIIIGPSCKDPMNCLPPPSTTRSFQDKSSTKGKYLAMRWCQHARMMRKRQHSLVCIHWKHAKDNQMNKMRDCTHPFLFFVISDVGHAQCISIAYDKEMSFLGQLLQCVHFRVFEYTMLHSSHLCVMVVWRART